MPVNILLTSLSKSVIGKRSREIFGLGKIEQVGQREERINLDGWTKVPEDGVWSRAWAGKQLALERARENSLSEYKGKGA